MIARKEIEVSKTPVIFLDFDDVIVDWAGPAFQLMGLDPADLSIRKHAETMWGGINQLVDEKHMWDQIHTIGAKFWADLPLLPWGNKLYSEMSRLGDVCFLTSPSDHPSCAAGKVESIKKLFNTRNWLIGKPKYLAASVNKVLVDDRPSNCSKFVDAGGQAFRWPNALKMMRLGNGDEIVERAVDFVKDITHHLNCGSYISFHCIPDPVDVEEIAV